MSWFLKSRAYPIGVDMGDDTLKLVQFGDNGKGISLIAGGSKNRPAEVKPGSAGWQRWAIEAICELTANGKFRGRDVTAAISANEVFIDHIKMPKIKDGKLRDAREAIVSKIKQKLPFDSGDAMIKYVPMEDDNVLVMATEREKINRHLAIYERANLQIKSIGVWPAALTNTYVGFFGRRKTDVETIVMLVCMEANCTNVVICRHKNLLLARSIPIGAQQLDSGKTVTRLALELTACRQHFSSMYRKAQIERLIFLSGSAVDKDVYATIAKRLEVPAQMGDCLAALEMADFYDSGIDRRECQVNWAIAFGLSLS